MKTTKKNPQHSKSDNEQIIKLTAEIKKLKENLKKEKSKTKLLKKALFESEEMYRALTETTPEAVTITDLKGKIIGMSRKALDMHGAENPDEVIGINAFKLIIPEDRKKAIENLNKTSTDGSISKKEYTFLKKNGKKFIGELNAAVIMDSKKKPRAFIATVRDITEKKAYEWALRESEQRYRTILDSIEDGYYEVDLSGNFIFFNNSMCKILGYSEEEMWKMNYTHYTNKKNSEIIYDLFNKVYKTGNPEKGSDWELIRKDGTKRYIEVSISLKKDSEGEPDGCLGIARDVTTRKKIENDLQKAKYEAEKANRTKSSFLANMSHELRTPLNGILGYTQILKNNISLDKSQKSALEVIEKSGEHLRDMINDILDLSKIEADKMVLNKSIFNISHFLDTIKAIIRLRAEKKGLDFKCEFRSEVPLFVNGDEKRLGQVLLNLLDNAVKFTDKGNIILIVNYSNSKFTFTVLDTGIGISRDQLTDIFSPFKQADLHISKIEGTGLGLTISRELVQMMGGELVVKSTPGKGTSFSFEIEIPEISVFKKEKRTCDKKISGYKGDKKKILIIEDNLINRTLLIRLLKPLGFDLYEAGNGNEGLEKAEKIKPDLIFMDMIIPGMDGRETATKIRKNIKLEKVSIIAVSATVTDTFRRESIEAGCNDFIPKPIDVENIMNILEKHLKIEWIYEYSGIEKNADIPSNKEKENIKDNIPSKSDIQKLYEFARKGDLKAIQLLIDMIKEKGKSSNIFVDNLQDLVNSFQINNIREFIKKFL